MTDLEAKQRADGENTASLAKEEKIQSAVNAANAPYHSYLQPPSNTSTGNVAVLKKQSVDSCEDPLSQFMNSPTPTKDPTNNSIEAGTFYAPMTTNIAAPIVPSSDTVFIQDFVNTPYVPDSYEQKKDVSNFANLPSSLASKFTFLANKAASTIQDAVQNATKGHNYTYSIQQRSHSPQQNHWNFNDGIHKSTSWNSSSSSSSTSVNPPTSSSSSKTPGIQSNTLQHSTSLKGNTSTSSIVSIPEMDHGKKNAVFSSALGSSTLLPGERIIMFLSHLAFVRDSSSPRTGVGYSPFWKYELCSTDDHKQPKDMVWCCAMTLYRLILFQYFESEFSDDNHYDDHDHDDDKHANQSDDPPYSFIDTDDTQKPRHHVVVQIPLSSIDRLERTVLDISYLNHVHHGQATAIAPLHNLSTSPTSHVAYAHGGAFLCLTVHGKDNGRFIRFATTSHMDTMRAYEALNTYAFPGRRNIGYLFAFESRREEVLSTVHKTLASTSLNDTSESSTENKVTTPSTTTWFDPWIEFQRMGIPTKDDRSKSCPWKFYSTINSNYDLCSSYPSVLIGPASIQDETLDGSSYLYKVASFRSEGRIPALTWCSRLDGASIWRSSQPKVGLQGNRSLADETFLKMIAEGAAAAKLISTPGSADTSKRLKPSIMYLKMLTGGINDSEFFIEKGSSCLLKIMDLRPKSSAIANRTAGYGYENISNYFNTTITFHGIGNIHAVRDSYNKLSALCTNPAVNDLFWSQLVEETKWLQLIRLILAASWQVAFHVLFNRIPVLVHCSHGWDRTSQVTSIAQILLDPYYRTRKGFCCLIEKDFLSFGHPFHTRCGHGEGRADRGSVSNTSGYDAGPGSGANDEGQLSPIFIQFLDCVFQIVNQSPDDFEFNLNYLLVISDHVYSCRFGSLLCDTEKERETVASIRQRTFCLWEYVNSDMTLINPNYKQRSEGLTNEYEDALMIPLPSMLRNVVLWSARHCMYGPKATNVTRWLYLDEK